ncbi:leucyl-tRNA synthetase [Arcicella aurantiaca]|uniref:Leucine--tRNA ligase n=1 Tax=Arcicella aurantiaca TaxID=591202 RepID=A0A316EGM6_9BACT|nr:leucine--tRNA ligase [Arcicella aurantiaca]PWK29224.1 leucyl-tRNA synthetase [Arcicella aurantiaca]
MEYNHKEVEQKWRQFWEENQTFKTEIDTSKPKYYVLDMFPYPSGAGLHVGHPLGYIASDIIARYKRLKGFNVLHPMGFDSFGLPAEQYAIQTGQHPAITTEENITTYIRQLKQIGFSYDWSREVRTSDSKYYKWTQWIFMQLFNHYYDKDANKALKITDLVEKFATSGNKSVNAVCDEDTPVFTSEEWNAMSEFDQQSMLLKYRLTYPDESVVNWCPGLGTVLANDEVKDGVSERGGFPVEQKKMKQWAMRITAYADRLIDGLNEVDWSDALKEQQRNWIGRSTGASVRFEVLTPNPQPLTPQNIEVFTTRVDTIYGVSFMVIAPEHEYVPFLTTPEQKEAVDEYVKWVASRSELDRMSEVKKVSGVFTGSYVVNPFNDEKVPIFLADYVLAGYGTGAVMGVPSGDQRDWNFATHFKLPIVPILDAQKDIEKEADNTKEGKYINSGIINGMEYKEATKTLTTYLEEKGIGKGKIQYRLRNAVFSRQRYWGEPVPVYFKDGLPYLIEESELPLDLPVIDKYLPTETGEPPLGRAEGWAYHPSHNGEGQGVRYPYELSTMPGWAGSSWYWYRYMDAQNEAEFASQDAINYWKAVDLYIGGSEHATGHLLYSRFWNKFLKDLGLVPEEEFAKKLINQGMIQGRSNFVYRVKSSVGAGKNPVFVSYNLKDQYETTDIHVDVNIVNNDILDVNAFKNWREDFANAEFILEDGKYVCGVEVEKMSKSKYNVVNPDILVDKVGADTLRLYEMFLGPLEQAKPWNTNGIDGSFRFIKKVWRLFYDDQSNFKVKDEAPTPAELKVLHTAIKKVEEDLERYSFNTVVSTLMICVNDLGSLKCSKKAILQELVILMSPYTPHIAEELWTLLGNEAGTISYASFPKFNPSYLVEANFEYPISINGKVRANISFPTDAVPADIEAGVLANEVVLKWLDGKAPKKVIVVPKRIVNVVM